MESLRFVLISDGPGRTTDRLLEEGCARRGIDFTRIEPGKAAGHEIGGRGMRRLIYRTGVSHASQVIEQLLARDGDALLHDPLFGVLHHPLVLRRAGIPMPRIVYVPDPDRDALARQAAALGGFPVVVKLPGFEGGKGVSLARNIAELARIVRNAKRHPMLESFMPHKLCWRVTVLGGSALAATARRAGEGDFRTNGPGSGAAPGSVPPEGLAQIAISAARALRLEFGGADIMQSPDGTLTLAEFNFPCYFADQQEETGIDIAGAIIDHLAAKPGAAAR